MSDEIGFMIFYAIAELLAGLVNFVLKALGYPEVTVKKLSSIIGWVIVMIAVMLLIIFTVKYS